MEQMKREALVALLIDRLREHKSWCGETHVQKAAYFLQNMLKLDAGFNFVLYKHGPFSFDLRDELTGMRADEFLDLEIKDPSYGPSLALGRNAALLRRLFDKTLEQQHLKIDFIASKFGDENVLELERLATALYVTRTFREGRSAKDRACELTSLKPHISHKDAIRALKTVDQWSAEAEKQFPAEAAGV
jgi:hypothetical protein